MALRLSPRQSLSLVAAWVPFVFMVGCAGWFLWSEAPQLAADEAERIMLSVKEASRDLLEDPSTADFVWKRGEGIISGDAARYAELFPADLPWKDWPTRGPENKKEKWGDVVRPEGRLVWVRDTRPDGDASLVYGRETEIEARDMTLISWSAAIFMLVVVFGLTFAATRYFKRSAKARDDFMAATAHDLTTPLMGLRRMIGRNDAEAAVLNERLIRLVGNIQDFLQLGGKRRPPEVESFDILPVYREAYALFREDYRDLLDGEDVPVEGAGDDFPRAKGDATRTMQIFWNLLGNDLKYAAPYGPVKVVFSSTEHALSIAFVDEGQGMTPAQMKRAFDRYYRAKTVLASGKGGFGIGLCTAREFAREMGGDLTVRPNTPKGCVFTLTLPKA